MTFDEWWELIEPSGLARGKEGGAMKAAACDAWREAQRQEREACAMMLDAEADRQEAEWVEYLASGKPGPATSLHGIPRGYAAEIRKLSNAVLGGFNWRHECQH